MTAGDMFAGPISFERLQQFKALSAPSANALDELQKIVALDISDFNEAEVRAYVIDPLVRILGYEKGRDFSVQLEKSIEFIEKKKKFPDYKFTLWEEDFWLIEAKRPRFDQSSFGYDDLAQALEYACHPKINAALVVLCDGAKIEIFDREVSIVEPLLRTVREDWLRDFAKIRQLLEPWQVWFFQKRRIVRLLDKVFDNEFNLDRLREFGSLVEGRLASKRLIVLKNFQSIKKDDTDDSAHMETAPLEELVEVHLFLNQGQAATNALIHSLVERSTTQSFPVMYKIFPDLPRSANDHYFAKALCFLAGLAERRETLEWAPAWLSPGRQSQVKTEDAVKRLLRLCLTNFAEDEARQSVVLAAAAIRRVTKILLLSDEGQWQTAEAMHFLHRYHAPELSWSQFISSPEGHMLGRLNVGSLGALEAWVKRCRDDRGAFSLETAKAQLKDIWNSEVALLRARPGYSKILRDRSLGEMYPTESNAVTCDYLGHLTLCMLRAPCWREYVIESHPLDLATVASMGSWSAKEMLGQRPDFPSPVPSDEELARRFFFGDVSTLQALRAGYQ